MLHVAEGGTHLGTLIRRARSSRGLTQEELADLVGVDRVTANRWENKGQIPDGLHRFALVRVLDQPDGYWPDWFVDGEDIDTTALVIEASEGVRALLGHYAELQARVEAIEQQVQELRSSGTDPRQSGPDPP